MNTGASDQQIRDIQDRLSNLGKEQRELTALLENLQRQKQTHSESSQNHPVTIDPITTDPIKLFVSLFRGRNDVFPKGWNKAKTGKSGYSPVCKNEWVTSVCNKPKISFGLCTNQAFMPVMRKSIGESDKTNTLFLSHSPGSVKDISDQIMQSMIVADRAKG